MNSDTEIAEAPASAASARRPWFRSNAFLVFAGGLLVVLGLFFLGLIAIVLLAGDRSRDTDSRVGGAVLMFAWMFTWTLPGVSPYGAFALLAIAAWFLLKSARLRRTAESAGGWRAPGALAAISGLAAVLALVPYGFRSSDFDADDAARRVLEARTNGSARQVDPGDFAVYGLRAMTDDFEPIEPSQRLVAAARLRFLNTPIYYVVLFEQNPTTTFTGDGEPCFSASETHSVHGLSGEVVNLGRQDAIDEDGGCLPLPRGTQEDLEEIPD
ncbi:MAG TPA: hypothetical protein VNA14_09040 [Mycobacteriales bacterium]|nr:hypothetical protein [Mycobacteriales bacterium]